MNRPSFRRLVAAVIPLALVVRAIELSAQQPVPADVQFMQHMIGHHAQALVMASLVPSRTTTESLHLLAQRIEVSQRDEIGLMRHWLQSRGQMAPNPDAPHEHHDMGAHDHEALMPGMLTGEQLAQLSAAKGTEFDRLFLELMIQHHAGALTMVTSLFATPGAGQEAEAFRFASDVEADQRAEIARMRTMLGTMSESRRP